MNSQEDKPRVVTSSIANYTVLNICLCVCEGVLLARKCIPPTCAGRFGPFLDFVTLVNTKITRELFSGQFSKILEKFRRHNTKGIR